IAEAESRRTIGVWGFEEAAPGTTVTRTEIEAKLADPNGAYQRLRRVMDAWCSLWFWPLTETEIAPPSIEEWIDACEQLLGKSTDESKSQKAAREAGQASMFDVDNWAELNEFESNQRALSGAAARVETVFEAHPWLRVTERIAEQQGFFHWDLDFATVFAQGGFDLQLGNPPWVRPDWNEADILSDFEIAFALEDKIPVERRVALKSRVLNNPHQFSIYLEEASYNSGNRSILSSACTYPITHGLRADLYRSFMQQAWRLSSSSGIVGLVHPESHFTDNSAIPLRQETYIRLRRHWQFINELKLFEIQNQKRFGINLYGCQREEVSFLQATSLFHPATVEKSLVHNGDGPDTGVRNTDGEWNIDPHASRIMTVTSKDLIAWSGLFSDGVPSNSTSMVYALNESSSKVLARLSAHDRIGALSTRGALGWDENADFKEGYFTREWNQIGRASCRERVEVSEVTE